MKSLTTLLLAAAGCSMALADAIPEEQALANARSFFEQGSPSPAMRRMAGKKLQLTKAMQSRGFYAFNINGSEGYVIASGSDRTQPVLGYSDRGSLDPANMPEPLKYWLGEIDKAVESIEAGIPQEKRLKANNIARVADKKAIAPLMTSKWNQGDPYNLLTPSYVDQNSGQTHEHSATGCVATATTQVMYYWKCPQEACKEIPSYTYNWSGNKRTTEALPPIVFDWEHMTDTYGGKSTQEEKMAVAQLMLYAGHGMQSGYAGATGATSVNALNALKNYFGYAKDAYNTYHLDYTFQEWEDLFYNELAAGRPLLMGADNYERTGGHEFVCDGYDGNGLYHINWGWGGWDDGYFVLTVMAPDNQGIGGSTDANGYSMGQNVCINLRPASVPADEETVRVAISNIDAPQKQVRKDTNGVFNVSFTYYLRTLLMQEYSVEYAFRLTAADNSVVADELLKSTRSFNPSQHYRMNASLKLQDLADGTYRLTGLSRKAGSDEWIVDDNADRNYLELVVEGNDMKVAAMPGQGLKLQVNSLKLEGASVAGDWQKVVYNITNNGNDYYGETYLFVDGTRSSGNTISIPAGETMDIYYKFKPTNVPGNHNFVLSRTTNPTGDVVISNIDRMYNIDCKWNEDGSITALPKVSGPSYEVPADAVAIYVYGTKPRALAVSKANPNLVVYYDEGVTIGSRVEKNMRKYITNIVIDGKAKEAGFKDGYPAAVPMPFTATTASYTRENMPEWTTVALPFDVQEITADGERVDWFTSKEDTGKNLFVKDLSGNRGAQLRFSHAEEMTANTAYLIGASGELNGSSFDHKGKSFTFTGRDVTVAIEGEHTGSYTANKVKLIPCYAPAAAGKLLGMDEAMENFTTVDTLEPFRAYVATNSTTTSYSIRYEDGEHSGIEDVVAESGDTIPADAPIYNMQGIKVGTFAGFDSLAPGLYIVAGRKVAR